MDIPDDVALEKQFAHHALVDTVDLANLCQLQSTWCTGEQEADDNENWIVPNVGYNKPFELKCHPRQTVNQMTAGNDPE